MQHSYIHLHNTCINHMYLHICAYINICKIVFYCETVSERPNEWMRYPLSTHVLTMITMHSVRDQHILERKGAIPCVRHVCAWAIVCPVRRFTSVPFGVLLLSPCCRGRGGARKHCILNFWFRAFKDQLFLWISTAIPLSMWPRRMCVCVREVVLVWSTWHSCKLIGSTMVL